MTRKLAPADVAAAFDAFGDAAGPGLMALRDLIFEMAATDPRIGRIEESLRWGQPAYLTPVTKSGTTLRLGVGKSGTFALFMHCRTSLIPEFKAAFPGRDRFDGNRAVLFDDRNDIDAMRHGWLVRQALTYHL